MLSYLKRDADVTIVDETRTYKEFELLIHFCLSLLRTQNLSLGEGEEQEDFPGDLTLHSDPLTPDGLPCTPANAVEVHRNSQPGEDRTPYYWGCRKHMPVPNL